MFLCVELKKALRDFSLDLRFEAADETLALLGASGCGKSMTLKCIAGIETPDSGRIALGGRVLYDSARGINLPPQQRRVGYLFQNCALFPNMTVAENIAFAARGPRRGRKDAAAAQIKRFRLAGLEDAYPAQLSGGQQQRVALARMLAAEPELMLLDEPFSALDSYLRWQLEQEVVKALETRRRPALFVSHDRNEVFRICDRIAVMSRGQIEAQREKQALFDDPATLAGTLLTGCKNISAARRLDAHTLDAADWRLTLRSARPAPAGLRYVGFRAHFFTVGRQPVNSFAAEVVKVVEDTFSYIVMVRPRGTDAKPLRWELDKAAWRALPKEELWLTIPAERLILLEK